tara:strand:- start:31212 stop:31760 length:549 start_codon:yes stop_codon:yes gene_type:complete
MVLLYAFENKKENIRVSADYQLQGNQLSVSFLVDDKDQELEDFYPFEFGKSVAGSVFPLENLWTTTCFEIFLKNENSSDYYEFNFNSKAEWNVFYFSEYRKRVEGYKSSLEIKMQTQMMAGRPLLTYSFDILKLVNLKLPAQINLSTVTKGKVGISYWSQKHNGHKADFHDPKNFTLTLNSR